MKFFETIGANDTKHFYEAVVVVEGERGEIEIQANTMAEAMNTAKLKGYAPESITLVC